MAKNQTETVYTYLRGTGRELTAEEAKRKFGIANLRARISELRQAGMKVTTVPTKQGKAYRISARDVNGSRAALKFD